MSTKIKPEDALKIVEYLGIDAENADDLKTKFDEKFVSIDKAHTVKPVIDAVWGKKINILEKKVKNAAKELDIDFDSEDLKDLDMEDKIVKIAGMAKSGYADKIKTLEAQVKTGDNDAVLKDWEKKYAKLETKYKETEGLLNTTKGEFETFKTDSTNKFKKQRIDLSYKEAFEKLNFDGGVDDLKKIGFKHVLSEKYEIDIDENEKVFIKDKANGQRIKSDKKAGEFMDINEVFEKEAIANKLINLKPVNNQQQQGNFQTGFNFGNNGNNSAPPVNQPPVHEKKPHPNALKAMS